MKPARLADRTRSELLVLARALGLRGVTRLPKVALARVIEVVRSRKTAPVVSVGAPELVFDRPGRVRPWPSGASPPGCFGSGSR